MMANEADTCRKHVVPKLQAAGWDNEPYSIAEQRTITDGRIVPRGQGFLRKPPKRVDYLLRYRRDTPLAVVEAKAAYMTATDAVQQARQGQNVKGMIWVLVISIVLVVAAYAVMLALQAEPVTPGNRAVEDIAPTPGPSGPAPVIPETAQSPS